jgi:DNA invertase Pin-like site-specific DNA recombinase
MIIYGYALVSTVGQTLDAQREALTKAGAAKIFQETASGAKGDRKELAKSLKSLGSGDTLLVTRLDRLAHHADEWVSLYCRCGALARIGESRYMLNFLTWS